MKKAIDRLTEFLDSECSDYDMSYDYELEDLNFDIEITARNPERVSNIFMRYNEDTEQLEIELSEDCYYEIKEWDWTVKYFCMLVSPDLFPNA